jgi:protein O-GlcNAc transferase
MTTAAHYNEQGVHLKRQGKFAEAQQAYEQALKLKPDFAEARYNLGVLWRDLGRVDLAIHCLQATVQLRPDVSVVQFELANLLATAGEFEQAIEHYEHAIELAPYDSPAMFNLANVCLQQERWIDAEVRFRQILESIRACVTLGGALQDQHRFAEAIEIYGRVLSGLPEFAKVLTVLGDINKQLGRLDQARECYERALAADSACIEARVNLANLCLESGWVDRAIAHYRVAADLQPNDPQSFVRLGNALLRVDRVADAEEMYKQSLARDPACFDAWLCRGHLRREVGDFDQSRAMYQAICRGQSPEPIDRLREVACCPPVFPSAESLEQYRIELEKCASSMRGSELEIDFRRLSVLAPECPYNLQFLEGNLRPLKEAFAAVFSDYFRRRNGELAPTTPCRGKPRIGFVVTHRHESAFLKLIAGVVERLNGELFDVCILCSTFGVAKIKAAIRRKDVTIVSFAERFDHIVQTVRSARCDLLYYWEIGNDPTNYFLPFLRLAPIQVTSWGIQVTSGIPNVDAYLSSEMVEGPEAQDHYSEKLRRATTLLTYQTPIAMPPTSKSREQLGLPAAATIYGCLQNLGKFHPAFDEVLLSILERDPRGLLIVAEDRHAFAANVLRQRWRISMASVYERIVFFPLLEQADYLNVLDQCDVLLDPLHFGGVTTTYDALWLCKPVVTLPTEFHRGRYTAGCLRKVGVTETIARDLEDYVDLAVSLAAERDRRVDLARRLFEARHIAFEDYGAVREHERIFQEMLAEVR